jgi:hypothetical protein
VFALHSVASGVLSEIIRRQPASQEKTTFAWTVSVGPAMSRATTVHLDGGCLFVRARDARWAHEVERARGTVIARLAHLLGPEVVVDLRVVRD